MSTLRSNRGTAKPFCVIGHKARRNDREPFSGYHQGQRSYVPHQQAGYMTAPDRMLSRQNLLATQGPSIHDAPKETRLDEVTGQSLFVPKGLIEMSTR